MAVTDYLGNALLSHAIGKTSFTMPSVWLALFTTAPTVGGGGNSVAAVTVGGSNNGSQGAAGVAGC